MNNKKIIIIKVISVICLIIIMNTVFAATTPTLVTRLNSALKKILGYLKTLSTPAAGVAVVSGVMIRKMSFGDEEKMRIGKKIIVNALLGYATVLLVDLILKFIDALV